MSLHSLSVYCPNQSLMSFAENTTSLKLTKIKTHIDLSSYVPDRYETNSSYLVAVSVFNSIVYLKWKLSKYKDKKCRSSLDFLERYETKAVRTFFAVSAFNSTGSPYWKWRKEHHQETNNKIRMSVSFGSSSKPGRTARFSWTLKNK